MRKTILAIIILVISSCEPVCADWQTWGWNWSWGPLPIPGGGGGSGFYINLQSQMLLAPTSQAFGSINTGSSQNETITLSNPGNDILEAANLVVTGTGYSLYSTTCGSNPFSLASLGTCNAVVQFAPTSGGVASGALTASAPNLSNVVATLSGTGVCSLPSAPTGTSLGTPTSSTIPYTFTAGSGSTSTNVKYGTTTSYGSTITGATSGGSITGLASSTLYDVGICAENACGETCASNLQATTAAGGSYIYAGSGNSSSYTNSGAQATGDVLIGEVSMPSSGYTNIISLGFYFGTGTITATACQLALYPVEASSMTPISLGYVITPISGWVDISITPYTYLANATYSVVLACNAGYPSSYSTTLGSSFYLQSQTYSAFPNTLTSPSVAGNVMYGFRVGVQ